MESTLYETLAESSGMKNKSNNKRSLMRLLECNFLRTQKNDSFFHILDLVQKSTRKVAQERASPH